MSRQLAAILHHPDLQKLEGSWRGLHYLVTNTNTGELLKIQVLNVSKRELFYDCLRAVECHNTVLFNRLYEDEGFGRPDDPYGALIGDYEFSNHPEDIHLLTMMSIVAAATFCPFISGASPGLLGFKDWTELGMACWSSGPRSPTPLPPPAIRAFMPYLSAFFSASTPL